MQVHESFTLIHQKDLRETTTVYGDGLSNANAHLYKKSKVSDHGQSSMMCPPSCVGYFPEWNGDQGWGGGQTSLMCGVLPWERWRLCMGELMYVG